MDILPGLIALGAVQGLLSALLAGGLVVAYRTHRFLNLAQAGFGLVAGAIVGVLVSEAGWSFWAAAPLGVAAGAGLGLTSERLIFARLASAPRLILMVASLGLAQVLGAIQTALPLAVGGVPPSYAVPVGWTVRIFPVVLTGAHLLTIAVAPLALIGLSLYLKSRPGLGAQAVGQNAERARSLGVPAPYVSAMAFAVVGAAGAVAGILSVPVLGFSLDGTPGIGVLLLALAPAAVAGFRGLGVAATAAVVLGVVYQLLLWFGGQARLGNLMLAGVVIAAVALRPPATDRKERAERASSWPAAPPVRPRRVSNWAVVAAAGLALLLGAVPLVVLGPGDAQLVATGAALALGALSLAVGWCLAGELSLATWPVAGAAALVATWAARAAGPVAGALVGVGAGAAAFLLLGLGVRRRGSLGFAVVSLAAGAALAEITSFAGFGPGGAPEVGAAAAALTALALVASVGTGVVLLRRSRRGHRLVAARDDARRARALGVDEHLGRLAGLALAGALAGLAGLAYLLAVAEPAPGTFAADRSLDLLAMAVVGGLGSFWGAVGGTAAILAARVLLDGGWALLGAGAGMIVVLLFAPGGLAAAAGTIRRPGATP